MSSTERSKNHQPISQMSSQKEGRMEARKRREGKASLIPIVKKELTAFPERLSRN